MSAHTGDPEPLRGCWVTGAAQSVMSGVDLVGVRRGDRAVIGRR
jgi:hypothetical protein